MSYIIIINNNDASSACCWLYSYISLLVLKGSEYSSTTDKCTHWRSCCTNPQIFPVLPVKTQWAGEGADGKSSFHWFQGFCADSCINWENGRKCSCWILPHVVFLLWEDIWKFWLGGTTRVIYVMSAQDYNSVCVCNWAYACVFLYITTVNTFLAQLNLSKQHTPSWAVKRADRETTERKTAITSSEFLSKKFFSVLWKGQEKREWGREREQMGWEGERWKSQCVVNSALSFSCYWNRPHSLTTE